MCGFTGVFSKIGFSSQIEDTLSAMMRSLTHRGPDAQGIWFDNDAHIGLAHTRLSILDLSPAGHQPMQSPSERYVIAFNGEIYNHLLLRQRLNNVAWRGHSDTETLLAGFEQWGIEETIKNTVGMFAFAVWDKQERILTLGRDRAGEKPLYYGWNGPTFLFGSELKALKKHPDFERELDFNALSQYLRHNYIPAPYSIYRTIQKLMPGSLLQVSLEKQEPILKSYWSAAEIATHKFTNPFQGDENEAVNELERLIKESISLQMRADVPVGAFLSGGVDSSTIVALMQAQATQPVRTFSIGFNEAAYNEAHYAKAVAEHLGTDHTELYINEKDALAVIPNLPTFYDEPFSDSSQIPTYLISALAKQDVTVAITGDAGDELFCGYDRYLMTQKLWSTINKIPRPMRQVAAKIIRAIEPSIWNKANSLIPFSNKRADIGLRLHKGASLLDSTDVYQIYHKVVSHFDKPHLLLNGVNSNPIHSDYHGIITKMDPISMMMQYDFQRYLPDDLLVKVDRAAMAVSLETRIPFLDHRVIEFAWSLPLLMKLKHNQTKWPIRQILYKHVPKKLIDRPKKGFGVPLDKWLNGPLQSWADELLDINFLQTQNIFNAPLIDDMWASFKKGQSRYSYLLWSILMFQAWWSTTT